MRMPRSVLGGLLAASLCSAGLMPGPEASAAAHRQSDDIRYVDCSHAEEHAGSGTLANPWRSIASINWSEVPPTGKLLFATGTTCHGTLDIPHSGTYEHPFTISDYSPPGRNPLESRAVIDGRYKEHDNTDATFAEHVIDIHNQEHIRITNLEIRNDHRSVTARRAISITTDQNKPLSNFEISSLFIHDFGNINTEHFEHSEADIEGPGSSAAAIKVEVQGKDNKNAKLNDVWIHDNEIEDVGFDSIVTWSQATDQDADPSYETAFTGLVIENNRFSQIRGGAVAVGNARNAIVQKNVLRGFITQGRSSAGMYPYYSIGTVFRENTITDGGELEEVGRGDGQAFDLDQGAQYTTFERNFTNNNREGFMLLCVGPGAAGSTKYAVIRYNLSIDDGKHGFKFSTCPEVVQHLDIYNNTFFIGAGIAQNVFDGPTQDMWGSSILYRNNIVTVARGGKAFFNVPYRHNIRFDHNVFHGVDEETIPRNDQGDNPTFDVNPGGTNEDPQLCNPAQPDHPRDDFDPQPELGGYKLCARDGRESPARDTGMPLDHAPTLDYWRCTEDTITPNIGASNRVEADDVVCDPDRL